ncbi:hypothetical protein [Rothia nasimurium]|uniref:hypothetical protein n=1 Tax=Rothia nasimurium TaxID=85336 RepID=UPI003BA0BA6A
MNFWKDRIRPFWLTFKRFVAVWFKRRARWAVRSGKNLTITCAVILFALFAVHQITKERSEQQATTDSNQVTEEIYKDPVQAQPNSLETSYAPGATGTPAPSPTLEEHDQSNGGATPSPSYETKDIPEPTQPAADRQDKDATLKALAQAYLSRGSNEDWKTWTKELTNDQLGEYLTDKDTRTPVGERGKSKVVDVRISEELPQGADPDTPVRYSRWITVTAQTETGGTVEMTYDVVLMLGENGWQATDMKATGWKVVEG